MKCMQKNQEGSLFISNIITFTKSTILNWSDIVLFCHIIIAFMEKKKILKKQELIERNA